MLSLTLWVACPNVLAHTRLVTTDIGDPGLDWTDLVPAGADVSVLAAGEYGSAGRWPDKSTP